MKKQSILLAFFLCSQLSAFSQYSVHGIVKDENGNAISGALVKIEQSFRGSNTNNNGEFLFTNLKTGDYKLNISSLGFETANQNISVNNNIEVTINLTHKIFLADEVVVRAIRATDNTPVSKSVITRDEIRFHNLGHDVPYLMDQTPSLVTTSDAGTGVGYTSFRIRGTDLSRINITMNGIPLNDAESHGVWWIDLPDIASSVENIQIQRGVGSSSMGAGAFGATINLQTLTLNKNPYAEVTSTAGSFNTFKNSVSFGTGLINGHLAFDGRVSKITSDGFIDRATSNLKSGYISGSYYTDKSLLKLIYTSGFEETYQAWNGIPSDTLKTNRTYNKLGAYKDAQGITQYYKNQVDHYQQDHLQLLFSHALSSSLNFNAALHYTKGKGYYEEYQEHQALLQYNLENITIQGVTIDTTNLVRRKWLDNKFYGFTWSLNYTNGNINATLGGGWNQYYGVHYGRVIWAQYASNGQPDHQYYYSDGTKNDFNIFAKTTYQLTSALSIYGDLQFRRITQSLAGTDKNLWDISQKHNFNFANPKVGFTIKMNQSSDIYGFVGIAHREPTRDNYVDAGRDKPAPKSERLTDYELGYNFKTETLKFGANLYYMDYFNQLVLTGQINEVGDPIMTNVKHSYRTGIELFAGIKAFDRLTWDVNATLSRNVIKNFVSYVDNWDTQSQEIYNLGDTRLAFSPAFVASSQLAFDVMDNLNVALTTKLVGKQYIDNTENEDQKLKPYFVNNLRLSYKIKTQYINDVNFIATINNIFNQKYETNAWVYQYIEYNEHKVQDGFYPQAGRNFMVGLILKF
ncbi:MAG: TonB-dependent receptor [Bacteroidota bacterium]|nr:TonB-dependent receptor [Bacteroidota bacterium]